MIGLDGIGINNLKVDIETFLKNRYLQEPLKMRIDNEGVVEHYRAIFKGLEFKVNSRFEFVERGGKKIKEYRPKTLEGQENRYAMLDGSLHNYFNNDEGNYTDFTPQQGIKVIKEWEDIFKIDIQESLINGLEFGLNILLPFDCQLVYNNLISYLGEPFVRDKEGGEIFYSCKTDRYTVKCYDKGRQYKLPYNLLRVEVNVTRMKFFETNDLKIKCLKDLLNLDIYEKLNAILYKVFSGIIFGDRRLNKNDMNIKEQLIYLEGNDPKTWNTKAKTEAKRKAIQRLKKSYIGVIDKYRKGVNFREVVLESIKSKGLELALLDTKSVHISQHFEQEENTKLVRISHSLLSVNHGQGCDNLLDSSAPVIIEKKILCSGCGQPIGTRKTYHSLDCKFRRDERNGESNPQHNFRTKYFKSLMSEYVGNTLFDISGTLVLNETQNEWISRKLKKNYKNKKS